MAVDKTDMSTLHIEEKPYTTVINDVVQGLKNPDALAIWVYLQSKSSGWRVIASYIQDHFGIGRQRYRAAMRCLASEGLITYVSHRNDAGQLEGKEIIVHWRPKIEHPPKVQETERSVSPTVGETTPYEIQESFTKGEIETKRSSRDELVDAGFDIFWKSGMRKAGKVTALRSFARLAGKDPIAFAELLAEDVSLRLSAGQIGFNRMMPSTYLNQRRWEDERPEACPHITIAEAWNEIMPAHITRVSLEDWRPGAAGYDELQKAWERLKTTPRRTTGKPAFQSDSEGIEFYRMVWSRLAKSRKLLQDSSSHWCRFAWAVKFDSTVDIARGAHD